MYKHTVYIFMGVVMETVRKNITLSRNQAEEIERFTRLNGLSISKFLRDAAIKEIRRRNDQDLLDYLRENTDFVSDLEQKEIDKLNLDDFKEEDFRELSIDEILRG